MTSKARRLSLAAPDIERAVLALMMFHPGLFDEELKIDVDLLADPIHARIFSCIEELKRRGITPDPTAVSEELARSAEELSAEAQSVLVEIISTPISEARGVVKQYVHLLRDYALRRRIVEALNSLIDRGSSGTVDPFDFLEEVERSIFSLANRFMRDGSVRLNVALKKAFRRLEQNAERGRTVTGVPSGYPALDALTAGWHPGELIVLAARPSMGKTSLALSFALNAALGRDPVTVAFFSLEMPADQIAMRMLSAIARVDLARMRLGKLSDPEWMEVARAAGRLMDAPVIVDDTPALTTLDLRTRCARIASERPLGLVVVDYLQLLRSAGYYESREREVAYVSRSLKELAREFNVPVIALSQLNRSVEVRGGDKRPMLSDLRDSGSLEQDADVVLFVYRPERYGITVDEYGNSTHGIAEVIVAKQRNGPTGTVRLAFVEQYARFENLLPSSDVSQPVLAKGVSSEVPF